MRPIQPLVRLPHSHIDPNCLSTVERATPPREFYEWAADHVAVDSLSVDSPSVLNGKKVLS